MPQIAAVVLAAGNSSRMGRNKLVVELGGRPLLRIIVDNVLQSRVNPVVVVTGHQAEAVEQVLPRNAVTIARNPDFDLGMSSSIRAGVRALPDWTDGALIVLGDMPAITPSLIDRMIAAFTSDRSICVAACNARRGNPVLFGRKFFPELLTLTGDTGAKRLIAANEQSVCEVLADDDGPLTDIDTPEALADLTAHAK